MSSEKNAVDSTYEIVKKHFAPEPVVLEPTAGPAATLVPVADGIKLVDYQPVLDARLPAPRRTKGSSAHETLASFNAHVSRFKGPHTSVFVASHDKGAQLAAVYNYDGPGAPAWRDHRATCALGLSDEWAAWSRAAAGEAMSQTDFAAFVEEHLGDMVDPGRAPAAAKQIAEDLGVEYATRARVRQLAYGLSIRAETVVTELRRSETGEATILYDEKHTASDTTGGAPVKVPGAFLIAVPVFKNDEVRYPVPVRLSYKRRGQSVVWSVLLHGADDVRKLATNELLSRVATETGVATYAGTPEPAAQ